jgi:hypothetical protein
MTSDGLKQELHKLVDILNTSHSVLYAKQQDLMRSGVLPTEPGRGPGSGARATTEAIALVVVAQLASCNMSELCEIFRRVRG